MRGLCLFLLSQVAILQSASVPVQPKCDCSATVMTCSRKQLTYIPQCHMMTSVEILDISYNHLGVIPNNSFANFPNFKNLLLNNAHITWLEPEAFKGVPLLEKIDLSNNYIDYIQPNTFISNTNLHTVILNNNPLHISEDEHIFVSSSVTRLTLSKCQIEHMSNKMLSALPGIQTLDLSHNSLTYLSPDTFTGLINLTVINVSNNMWKCDDNFRTMMCWIHERGQNATVPATCYDKQHNRQKWIVESCMSVTTNTQDSTRIQYSTETQTVSTTEVTWTHQNDASSYSAVPTKVANTVLNDAVTRPHDTQSDAARQPSDTLSTEPEENWMYSKTFSFIEVTFLTTVTIMLVLSVVGGIFTARFILKYIKPLASDSGEDESNMYEEIPNQYPILKNIRVMCFSAESC